MPLPSLRRLHHHARGAVAAEHVVVDRAALQRHLHHVAARLLHRLLHGHRDLAGLALAHADRAVAVAHHRERREAEDPAALHHLGDAVHRDHLLAQAVAALVLLVAPAAPAVRFSPCVRSLELEAAFAGRFGERLDAAVVAESRAVERDFASRRRPSPSRRCACPPRPRRPSWRRSDACARTSFSSVEAEASTLPPRRIDHLRVDVQVGAVHREAHRAPGARCARASWRRGAVSRLFLSSMVDLCRYFFLVSLMTTFSSA